MCSHFEVEQIINSQGVNISVGIFADVRFDEATASIPVVEKGLKGDLNYFDYIQSALLIFHKWD